MIGPGSRQYLARQLLPGFQSPDIIAQADKKTEDAVKKDAQALSKLADAAFLAEL